MAQEVEVDFENVITLLEENKIDEAKEELNILKDYVIRHLQNYEDNYKRVSESELYDINDYDFI